MKPIESSRNLRRLLETFPGLVRRQEISIRMALGAQRGGIMRLVLSSAAKLALAGCTLGVLGSLAVARLVSSFLFEVSAADPIICPVHKLLRSYFRKESLAPL